MKRIFKRQKHHHDDEYTEDEKLEYGSSKEELLEELRKIKEEIDEVLKENP